MESISASVRRAHGDDAQSISDVVRLTLGTSNAGDYPAAVIERIQQSFSPSAVLSMIERRVVFVALVGGGIVGTAALEGEVVRTVFVLPELQGRGVGRQLMAAVEAAARDAGTEVLRVPASLTARDFYAGLGYRDVREVHHGEERTILMERRLPARS